MDGERRKLEELSRIFWDADVVWVMVLNHFSGVWDQIELQQKIFRRRGVLSGYGLRTGPSISTLQFLRILYSLCFVFKMIYYPF